MTLAISARLPTRMAQHPLWRDVALPYWGSPERRGGLLAVALMVALAMASIWGATLTASLSAEVVQATIDRTEGRLRPLIGYTVLLGLALALGNAVQTYVQSWMEIRWRRRTCEHLIRRWMQHSNHFRLEREGRTDNPDARIEYDTTLFLALVPTLFLVVLTNAVSIVTFSGLLWSKEEGLKLENPGLLTAGAWGWALLYVALVHWAGRKLVAVTARQDAVQADFRFAMTEVRKASEQIAFFGGEAVERRRLSNTFDAVAANFRQMMAVRWRLNVTNMSLMNLGALVPVLILMPGLMSGRMEYAQSVELGVLFGQLVLSLVFIANTYDQWAMCAATGRRLAGLVRNIEALPLHDLVPEDSADGHLRLHGLTLYRPDGSPLVGPLWLDVPPGGRCLITGPSGVGKSTLLRAVAGLWPHCEGRLELPAEGSRMFVPQSNYLPTGPLKAALTYPKPDDALGDDACAAVLHAVQLPALAARLHDSTRWSDELSSGEQQRVAFARVLLQRPRLLFLDESTSALDEDTEALLYQLILDQLPECIVISVAHRSTLRRFHTQMLRLEPAAPSTANASHAPSPQRALS